MPHAVSVDRPVTLPSRTIVGRTRERAWSSTARWNHVLSSQEATSAWAQHLAGQKPVINREVEIQPSRLDGGRTDVLIQAADPRDADSQPLTVIIEVKGCWNPEISAGIGQQLAPYLQPRPGWAGIFLVGYFHAPSREHERYKRRRHCTRKGHTAEQVLADLRRQQAAAVAADIHVRVLRLPLIPPPATSAETPRFETKSRRSGGAGCPQGDVSTARSPTYPGPSWRRLLQLNAVARTAARSARPLIPA